MKTPIIFEFRAIYGIVQNLDRPTKNTFKRGYNTLKLYALFLKQKIVKRFVGPIAQPLTNEENTI